MKNLRPQTSFDHLAAPSPTLDNGGQPNRALASETRVRVSTREAARLANCSLTTIYRLLKAGFIAGARLSPRKILVEVTSLQAHVQALQDPDFWTTERRSRYWGALD